MHAKLESSKAMIHGCARTVSLSVLGVFFPYLPLFSAFENVLMVVLLICISHKHLGKEEVVICTGPLYWS